MKHVNPLGSARHALRTLAARQRRTAADGIFSDSVEREIFARELRRYSN